ncbi:MAG: serine hydrolase domain-containing protein [Acidimicrobiales bacterium]
MTTRPEDVGMSSERLGRVEDVTHAYVDHGKLPGVQTLISRRGELVHHDCYGFTDVDAGTAVTSESIYRIYSMTKPITSVGLMMLFEEGRFLLENPVSRFLPEFADVQVWDGGTADAPQTRPPARAMTVHDVLTHLSGLTYGFHYQHPVDELYRNNGLGDFSEPTFDLAEGMERLASLPLLQDPGTRWNYSMSTDVCGRLIEVMSGQSLDEYLRDRILDPLGMRDTGFHAPESELERCGPLYVRGGDGALKVMAPSTTMVQPPKFLSGGGGLVGTGPDYLRFCHMLGNGGELDGVRLLSPRTLGYMTRNHLPGGKLLNEVGQSTFSEAAMEGTGFGLGFSVIEDAAALQNLASEGEFAWGGAASTAFWVDPVEDICAVFMTQLLPSDTYPIRRQLRAVVLQAVID